MKQILQNEELYRILFNSMGEGFAVFRFILDSGKPIDISILDANPAIKNHFGFTREQLTGHNASEFLQGFSAIWLNRFDEINTSRSPVIFEEYSGRLQKWLRVNAFPLQQENLFGALIFDITEEKKKEELLSAGAKLLETILNTIPVMVTLYDPGVTGIRVNKEFERLTGWTQEEINQGNIMEMVYPDPSYRSEVEEFMHYGKGWRDIVITSRKGSKIETTWANVKLPDGRQVGIGLDISERKKTEELILTNEAMMEAFFESSPGILNIFDKDLNFVKTDSETPVYFNQDRKSIIGKSLKNLNPAVTRHRFFSLYNEVLETGKAVENLEVEGPIPSKAGEVGNWLLSFFPVPFPKGERGLGIIGFNITKQKKAEKALRESEERYRKLAEHLEVERSKLAAVIDNLPVGVGVQDSNGQTLSMNKAGLTIHGFASEKEMFTRLNDYIHEYELLYPDRRLMPVNEWPVSRAVRGIYMENFELILRNKHKGMEKILSYSVAPVKNSEGEVILIIYVIQDLTEAKKAEQALCESEERFRTLADNISQLVWMADSKGYRFWFNKRWFEYTGCSLPEVEGWGWKKVHHPDYAESVIKKFKESVSEGKAYEDIFPLRNSKGGYRWFLARALPVHDDKGKIVRWFGTNTDIHEQKELEEDLNRALESIKINEAKLLATQKLVSLGSVEIYPETGKIVWSDIMYDIFERDKKLGPPGPEEAQNYVHPEDRENVNQFLAKAVNEKEQVAFDFRIVLPGNKIKYVYYVISPYFDKKGNLIKRYNALLDITERKLSQLKLEQAISEAETRLREKEVLLKELYHRTKNNMQVISSLLGLKAASISDTSVKNIIEDIQNRIRAIALVHQRLYQSRNLSRINLKEYVSDLGKLLLVSHNPGYNFDLKLDLEEISVLIDTAIPCGLVITELVSNAFKHAFPGNRKGIVEIKLKKTENDSILLVVSDNGIGIKDSDLDNGEKLGLKIFKDIAENQLEAEISLNREHGVSWSVQFKDILYKERI